MTDQDKIHAQCFSNDPIERRNALTQLKNFFSFIPDKQQAWNDLLRLTNDKDRYVGDFAVEALDYAFSQMPDKQQAWNDLHRRANDKNSFLRSNAAYVLGYAFSQMPDKQQAWNDLHRLTNDKNRFVRSSASRSLCYAFSLVPDKQQAWKDLHRLTNDEDILVRSWAAKSLCYAFSLVPDKQQAWKDLHRLTNDKNSKVRSSVAWAFGSTFSLVPDKQQAWSALHRLTNDKDSNVRYCATYALGSAFSQVPDKQQAWNDLHRLVFDKDRYVRTSSNHSLGRVFILKASQAETDEDFRTELEKAIEFFETAVKEAYNYNPAQFCLPFYRSFHTIIFKGQEAKEEANKYLAEAKAAIEDSESEKQLFKAVENLANALKEVQNLEKLDLSEMKNELNFYKKYCDQAAELMKYTDEKAPFVTEVLRKGFPILDRNLKGLIEEIQEKARTAYKKSIGTNLEGATRVVCKEVQKWEIGDQDYLTLNIETLIFILEAQFPKTPENKPLFDQIEKIREENDIVKQYAILNTIIPNIPKYSANSIINSAKKPLSKKILNSLGYSLTAASALAALSYSVCGIFDQQNQHYISIGVFTIICLSSFMLFFVISEK